ncbi:MAG: SIR2 family protein [Thermoplasmatales archaeon]|nr:SIR2 family protein [Thermoplasmatales archaeon]
MKKLTFIIGAGASKAIAPKEIPAMNDFFHIANNFAKQDKNIKTTLNSLERYGLLGNKEVNLEHVLEHTTKLPRNHDNPWERPYDGLLLTLHKIFHMLNERYRPEPFMRCFEPIKGFLNDSTTFISFNYDVFLERALNEILNWKASFGYSPKPLVGFIECSQADYAQSDKSICDEVYAWGIEEYDKVYPQKKATYPKNGIPAVLKPHGSLNWFIHSSRNPLAWIPNCNGLLLMGYNKEIPSIPKFWSYNTVNSVKGEFKGRKFFVGGILPAIVPPGRKFVENRKAEVFQKIYEIVVQELMEASVLVIIGWSMSEFDKHYKQLFEKVKKRKPEQLNKLAICDVQKGDAFYEQFKRLLPYKDFLVCKEGFGSNKSVELLRDVVI